MNILMLGRWVPPPRRPVRAMREYQFARYLARTHRLTLAFVTDNPDTAGSISALRSEFRDLEFAAVPRGWKSLTGAVSLATGESCTLSYFRSEALRTRLDERLRRTRYDLVCVSSSGMIQYALDIDQSIPLMVDFGEVDSEWWLQRAARGSFPGTRFFRTEASRLRAAEATAARRAVRCVGGSAEAAEIVKGFAPEVPMIVIPNGVDVEALVSSPAHAKVPTVVLSTSLGRDSEIRDAIEFQRTVMPIVRERVPGVRLVILSKEPVNPTLAGALRGAELVGGGPDPALMLHQSMVAVAPLRHGRELRRTVLEPMGAALPVVATSAVLKGLAVTAGFELLVADEPKDFALKVVQLLLANDALRAELGARGQSFVSGHYSWNQMASQFGQVVEGINQPPASAAGTGPVPEPLARAQL